MLVVASSPGYFNNNIFLTCLRSACFKLRYQYREYHYSPADLHTVQPNCIAINLNRIHNHLSTVGLVLAYQDRIVELLHVEDQRPSPLDEA